MLMNSVEMVMERVVETTVEIAEEILMVSREPPVRDPKEGPQNS